MNGINMEYEFGNDFDADKELAQQDPAKWAQEWLDFNDMEVGDLIYNRCYLERYPFNLELIEVQCEGGGEGQGEYVCHVFAIAPGGSKANEFDQIESALGYVSVEGFYTSHEGTEWDDEITTVKPRRVEITVFD
jgi:hypothetical protein